MATRGAMILAAQSLVRNLAIIRLCDLKIENLANLFKGRGQGGSRSRIVSEKQPKGSKRNQIPFPPALIDLHVWAHMRVT